MVMLQHLRTLPPGGCLLLLLDNVEQLANGPALAELLAPWLQAAPGLQLLLTSRSPAQLPGEARLTVPPLGLPAADAPPGVATQAPAVQLFLLRARVAGCNPADDPAERAASIEICNRLDDLPLALELATAWLPVLSARALLARLDQPLPLLAGGGPALAPHQRSLRDTLDWSFALLPSTAHTLACRLAVFDGGCSLEAAVQVAGDGDTAATRQRLQNLIAASLLLRDDDEAGETRYRLLQPVREFALERLQARDDPCAVRQRQLHQALALAEAIEPLWCGPQRRQAALRLAPEAPNLHAALQLALTGRPDNRSALRLAAALSWWWYFSGRQQEGRQAQRAALALPDDGRDPALRARAELGAARLALYLFDMPAAVAHGERAVALARAAGDAHTLAWAQFQHAVPLQARDSDAAVPGLRACIALFETLGDDWGMALAASYLGIPYALRPGQEDTATTHLQEGRARFAALGDSWGTVIADHYLSIVALRQGRLDAAREHARSAVQLSREDGDGFRIASGLQQWARVEAAAGRWSRCCDMLQESALLHLRQSRSGIVNALLAQAGRAATARGDDALAASLYAAAAVQRGPVLPLPPDADALAAAVALQALRERSPEPAFEGAWARGHAWSLSEAVQTISVPASSTTPTTPAAPATPH